jgi:hypothetical protein
MNADKNAEESEAADKDQDIAEGIVVAALEKPQEASESDPAADMPPTEPSTDNDVAKPEDVPKDEAGGKDETKEESTGGPEEKVENKAETEDAAVAQETAAVIPEVVDEPVTTETPPVAEPATAIEPAVADSALPEKIPEIDPLLVVEAMRKLSAASQADSGKAHLLQCNFNAPVNQFYRSRDSD